MSDLDLSDFRIAFATALAGWFRGHAIVCEHTQVIHFGDAAGAILNTPEFAHLRKLTATCTCGATYATYEGPEPDCAVHGAVMAFNAAQDEIVKLRSEIATLSAELNSAWKHAQLLTADRNLWRANSDTANAALRAGIDSRATEHARHSQAYVNVDDGYPWLTCGECDGPLHCIDGGDRLDTLTQAVTGHECATEQSAEAA